MGYYSQRLAGERLRECYRIAPARVRRYLEAEIRHVLERLRPEDEVLELGCGYGRVVFELAKVARRVVGIDTAVQSLALAAELAGPDSSCEFLEMDAARLELPDASFDCVVCIQNGICAFRADQRRLLAEALRVARPGGRVLLSSYAARFWPHRLRWFEMQVEHGLLGEIDTEATGDGVIVCKDGFRSGAMSPDDFASLCADLGVEGEIEEVDGSSLFCEIELRP
jgi:2-polyprenyl-6-hydroxyphenyl methylase/3-demethylubiquinone-9 3-methyltransferase